MIQIRDISDNPTKLIQARDQLQIDKMHKDRDFTVFLDDNDKDMQEDTNHPSWATYRKMLTEYSSLNSQLALVNYHISKHV